MKQLKYLLLILPFLFIGSVKADVVENTYIYQDISTADCQYYYNYDYLLEHGYKDKIERLYSMVMEEYNSNYINDYKYYVIALGAKDSNNCNSNSSGVATITMSLTAFDGDVDLWTYLNRGFIYGGTKISSLIDVNFVSFEFTYNVSDNLYLLPGDQGHYFSPSLFHNGSNDLYHPMAYFISNYNFVNSSVTYDLSTGTHTFSFVYHVTGYGEDFTVGLNDTIYPMFSADSPFDNNNNYVEINLNDYDYVILSYKEYNEKFFASIYYNQNHIFNFYVKGNFCLTPVYDFGMTERKDILDGTQVERCSPYYENYTPVRFYMLLDDTENNSVYYLKAYDTSKDNYVKIDTSIFDITYISEENRDNPSVIINGRSYPIIPYDSLTDTATKSEDEGYVSGAVEEFSFSDIFTAPLEALKDVWQAVISFFAMITEFLALLPAPLQGFLFTSFTLAIVLGLIKILL